MLKLTKKEQEIYGYLLEGKDKKQIADDLIVSQSTIATHIASIFYKKKAHSKVELLVRRIKELETKINELIGTTDRNREENDPMFYR